MTPKGQTRGSLIRLERSIASITAGDAKPYLATNAITG